MMSTDEFENLISDSAEVSLPEGHDDAAQDTEAQDILKQQIRQKTGQLVY